MCTCVCFCCVSSYTTLTYRARYSERALSCYLFVGSYSPEELFPSLHNTRVKSQCAQHPVCVLMVPAYARDAASSLVMPVGCFQSSPLPASHAHVSISLSVVCSHAVVPNFCLCLFLLGLFPRCEHTYPRQRGARRRGGGNSTLLEVDVCIWLTLPLFFHLCQSAFQLDLNCIIGTVSFSFSFSLSQQLPFRHFVCHSLLTPTLSRPDRYFTPGPNCWRPLSFMHLPESVTRTPSHSIPRSQCSETTCREATRCCQCLLWVDVSPCQSKSTLLILLVGAEPPSTEIDFI